MDYLELQQVCLITVGSKLQDNGSPGLVPNIPGSSLHTPLNTSVMI